MATLVGRDVWVHPIYECVTKVRVTRQGYWPDQICFINQYGQEDYATTSRYKLTKREAVERFEEFVEQVQRHLAELQRELKNDDTDPTPSGKGGAE